MDTPPPNIFETTKGMTMKYFTRCWYILGGTKSMKTFDIADLVCILQTKILINSIFGNVTSRNAKNL